MFSHVMVGSNDLDQSKQFYDATFGVLGYGPAFQDPKGRIFWVTPKGNFGVTAPIDGEAATHGNGMTIGFACDSEETVNAWHKAGVDAGGTSIEDAPGMRPMGAYLAYLRDPAGNKLCAMYRPAA